MGKKLGNGCGQVAGVPVSTGKIPLRSHPLRVSVYSLSSASWRDFVRQIIKKKKSVICSPAALINMQKKKNGRIGKFDYSWQSNMQMSFNISSFFFFRKKVTNRLFTVNGHSNQIESKSWNQSKNKPVTPVVADLIELGPQWNTPGFQLSPKHRLHSVVNQIFSYEIFFFKENSVLNGRLHGHSLFTRS